MPCQLSNLRNSHMDNMVSPPYSKTVLIGNWMDRRYYTEEQSNAILPGLRVQNGCEKHKSVAQVSYNDEAFKSDEALQYYQEQRMTMYANFLKSRETGFSFYDKAKLMNNFTSTNTLVYDVLVKRQHEKCRERAAATTNKTELHAIRPIEPNLLLFYGNLTKTGLLNHKRCQQLIDKTHRNRTLYSTDYSTSNTNSHQQKPFLEYGQLYDGAIRFELGC